MLNVDNLLRAKFSPFQITAESFPTKKPYVIIGDTEETSGIQSELQQQGALKFKLSISLPNIEDNKTLSLAEQLANATQIKGRVREKQHILFSSRFFIPVQKLLGLEYINSNFDYFHLVKIWYSPMTSNSLDNTSRIKCIYQRPVIDWAYEKMLSGETKFAAELLELYLNLYAPRSLSQIDRIKFLHQGIETGLPDGSMASIFNSGGKIKKSWLLYKHAVTSEVKSRNQYIPLPFIDQEIFTGKKVVFRRVPGPSDEILYANIFNQLHKDGCHVIVETDERLTDLFTRSFPNAEIIPRQVKAPHSRLLEGDIDFQANFSDPFIIYRDSIKKFPDHGGYLITDLKKTVYWKNYFRKYGNTPRIGISWGSLGTGAVTNRFTTRLNQWEHILTQPGVQFFNLEYGNAYEDIAWAKEKLHVKIHTIEGLDLFNNLDSLASVISNLDLVISINNINTNLAGALNIPTWEIIPSFWYYLFGTDVHYFFPRSRVFKWVGEQDRSLALNRAGDTLKNIMRKVKSVNGDNALFRRLSFREFNTQRQTT
jgi:hypothetical protein